MPYSILENDTPVWGCASAVPLLCLQQCVQFPAAIVAWAMETWDLTAAGSWQSSALSVALLGGADAHFCPWSHLHVFWSQYPMHTAIDIIIGDLRSWGSVFLPWPRLSLPAVLHHRWPCRQPAILGNKPHQLHCSSYLPYLHYCSASYKEILTSKESQATAKCFHYKERPWFWSVASPRNKM